MWQPNRAQWWVIWTVAILLILAWPPREGRSLAVNTVRWLADPRHDVPVVPDPLPMGLGDDGNAVAEHDQRMQEYYAFHDRSATNRLRLRLKNAEEPGDPGVMRQVLTAVGGLGVLGVWRLNGRRDRA